MTREDILDIREPIELTRLSELISEYSDDKEIFHLPPQTWGGFFQSPVDKVAYTLNGSFKFDELGTLDEENLEGAKKDLLDWLELPSSEAIDQWLKEGIPFSSDILRRIKRRLRKETLTNQALYDQPICRLVRRDQLR